MTSKILIVDDHPVVREGLAMHLANQADLELCGEAEDMPGAMAALKSVKPDLAIIDISLKQGSGIDLIKRISDSYPAIRILTWSMYPDNLYAERALQAGAHGYLHKGRATAQLIDAIRAVLAGKVYVSEQVATDLLHRATTGKAPGRSPVDLLSNRELQTFELLGQGQTTEKIAAHLHVSPKTVETYRARIKDKLGLSNVTELIQRAAQWVMENK
jgi:DNA-binding NarL/FixJ family response regulator